MQVLESKTPFTLPKEAGIALLVPKAGPGVGLPAYLCPAEDTMRGLYLKNPHKSSEMALEIRLAVNIDSNRDLSTVQVDSQ